MATLGIAGRSTSTLMRATWRATTTRSTINLSPSLRSRINPNFPLPRSPTSPFSFNGSFLRRELCSLLPLHSRIASSCLVSKLPRDVTASAEGRFANYLSPI
ncbi:uncharacterized protein LOC126664295 [Mercurialis annua]|uniref:uncharacterized protein LOC126664295 n=1 Tax=Mercurialis annua TaxID=3986 RepID=UPI00215F8100|nr:uncharacterized protein LOC126664295 [Mercurialis annua]